MIDEPMTPPPFRCQREDAEITPRGIFCASHHEALGNLCAVIFRDGGQRADELGSDAGAAAEAVVVETFAEVERLTARVAELEREPVVTCGCSIRLHKMVLHRRQGAGAMVFECSACDNRITIEYLAPDATEPEAKP